jgi:hypothetical protein
MEISSRQYGLSTNGKDYIIVKNLKFIAANVANVLLDGANQSELNYAFSLYGASGVRLASNKARLHNTVIYGNRTGVEITLEALLKNSILRGNDTDIGIVMDKSSNIIESDGGADPNFVSAPSDFHLNAGSPAIDGGVDVGLTTDYEGKTLSGMPDLGAFEF